MRLWSSVRMAATAALKFATTKAGRTAGSASSPGRNFPVRTRIPGIPTACGPPMSSRKWSLISTASPGATPGSASGPRKKGAAGLPTISALDAGAVPQGGDEGAEIQRESVRLVKARVEHHSDQQQAPPSAGMRW